MSWALGLAEGPFIHVYVLGTRTWENEDQNMFSVYERLDCEHL